MRHSFCCILLLILTALATGQAQKRQEGTIVRMRMTDCIGSQHKFMTTMSGGDKVETGAQCPEYVLVTDQVVYVISSKTSDALIPLAEVTRFRLQKNEMLIRIDDAAHESRFTIKEMILRSEWEAVQKHLHDQLTPQGAADGPTTPSERH